MISYADLIAAHPEAKGFPVDRVAPWIDAANSGLPDGRFKRDPDRARMLFVMHQLTKPLDIAVPPPGAPPHAWRGRAHAAPTKTSPAPHQWRGTKYGERLIAIARY